MSRWHMGVWSIVSVLALSACAFGADEEENAEASESELSSSAPAVSSISPRSGAPGTVVEVRGSNFARGATVTFGGTPAQQVERVNRGLLRVVAPERALGAAVVKVKNPNSRASSGGPHFEYSAMTPTPTPTPTPSPPPSGEPPQTPPPAASCTLRESGPIRATTNGQVIENVRVTSTNGPAIEVEGKTNVIIRNVEVFHNGGPGIAFSNASGLRIENVRVVHTGAPAKGPNPNDERNNIEGLFSSNVIIDHVRLERGSSGVYLIQSPKPTIRFVEGHDFRGPFPRGQLVQVDNSADALIEDFSVENLPDVSWPEDNISIFQSANAIVRRGLIKGNNSPSGVGVMFEAVGMVGTGGVAEDIDTIDMGNGSFSAYPSRNVTFRRARTRDTHCGSQQGRGAPLSNALLFAAPPESSNIRIEAGRYFNHCNPNNLVWEDDHFSLVDLKEENFTPRAPQRLSFCWSPPAFR